MTKTVRLNKLVVSGEGRIGDSIVSIVGEDERRTPQTQNSCDSYRCRKLKEGIQALSEGYFLWQTPKSNTLDLMNLEKMRQSCHDRRPQSVDKQQSNQKKE